MRRVLPCDLVPVVVVVAASVPGDAARGDVSGGGVVAAALLLALAPPGGESVETSGAIGGEPATTFDARNGCSRRTVQLNERGALNMPLWPPRRKSCCSVSLLFTMNSAVDEMTKSGPPN